MKILVTGATGYIGVRLAVRLLRQANFTLVRGEIADCVTVDRLFDCTKPLSRSTNSPFSRAR